MKQLGGLVKKLKKNDMDPHHITIIIALILAGLVLLLSNASAIDVFVNLVP